MKYTQDMRLSYLPYLKNSYRGSEAAPIDKFLKKAIKLFNEKGYKTAFCCSGHTNSKNDRTIDIEKTEKYGNKMIFYKPYRPECYVSFKENYPHIEQITGEPSIIRLHSCGTLMGIKKACRKMYRIAQSLEAIN